MAARQAGRRPAARLATVGGREVQAQLTVAAACITTGCLMLHTETCSVGGRCRDAREGGMDIDARAGGILAWSSLEGACMRNSGLAPDCGQELT